MIFSSSYRKRIRWALVSLLVFLSLSGALFADAALTTYALIDNAIDGTTPNVATVQSNTVFISDTVGYFFYRDLDNTCVYSKTTNGGATWGSAVVVDAQPDCINVSVWYDRWTPGDTTGTTIHIATIDVGNDSLWYVALNTSNDSLSTILEKTTPGTLNVADNNAAITKSTTGILYMASIDNAGSVMYKCSASCTVAGNWTNVGSHPFNNDNVTNILILPITGGDIMAVWRDGATAVDDMYANSFTAATAEWNATTTIDANAPDNTTHIMAFGATVDANTGDVYLAYVSDHATLGTDDDIRTARYTGGSWSAKTDILTNTTKGLIDVSIAYDETTKRVIAAYTGRTTPGTSTTGNVYYKSSTDGMATWSAESAVQNGFANDLRSIYLDPIASTTRAYVAWADGTRNAMYGNTLDQHNYYVRKNAANPADGLTAATATSSIQTAANMADDDADGTGDVIYIGAGTYYEAVSTGISGSSNNLFSFVGDTMGTTTGDAGDVVIVSTGVNAFTAAVKNYIELSGIAFTGASGDGILLNNSGGAGGTGWVIRNAKIFGNGGDGIQGNLYTSVSVLDSAIYGNTGYGILGTNAGQSAFSSAWTIRRNIIYGNGSGGVLFQSTNAINSFLITDNAIYNNNGLGLQLGNAANGTSFSTIRDNQIFGNNGAGIVLTGAGVQDAVVNNLVYSNSGDGITLGWGGSGSQMVSDSQFSNNTIYDNGAHGFDSTTSGTDPTVKSRLYNNIIAGNRSNGIISDVDRTSNTYNDVVENRLGNYSVISAGTGEISKDPFFTASSTDSTGTYSLNFDNSNDLVSIPTAAAFDNLSTTATVEAWVKPSTLAANDGIVDRWGAAGSGTRVWSMSRGSGTNGVGVMVSSNGGNATCNATSTAVMATSRWNHVAFSLDGTRLNISVNGAVESFPCTSALYTSSGNSIQIGGNRVGSFFDGQIDEVRVSGFPLYAASSTSGTATSTPARFMTVGTSTVALWHMNNGTGQTVSDAGPNGLDGTLGANSSAASDDPAWVNSGPDFGAFLRTATSTTGVDSPAINGGNLNPNQNGVASSTTRIDGLLDDTASLVDWGYHYASSTLIQNNFRFYTNTDAITPTSASAATNTAITNVASADVVRIRMNAIWYSDATTTNNALHGATFKLQYGQNATCSSVSSWIDVGATGSGTIWRGYNNTSVSDGRALPSSLLTSGLLETYQENAATTTPSPLVAGLPAEWDWALQNNGAVASTDYCFRMVHNNASSTPFASYGNYPKITTAAAASAVDLQQLRYRWRNDTAPETDTSTWLAAENTSASVERQKAARLRVEISNEGTSDSTQTRFRLEYGALSTTCSAITAWAPVGNAGSTTASWIMQPSGFIENNASTTDFSGSLTNENGTFLAGVFKDTDAQTTGMNLSGNPTTGHFTEHEFSLVTSAGIANGGYCFRLTDAGSTANFTYTVYPQVTVISPVRVGGGGGSTSSDQTPNATTVTGGTGQGGGGGGETPAPTPTPVGGGGGQGGGGGESGFRVLPPSLVFRWAGHLFEMVGIMP